MKQFHLLLGGLFLLAHLYYPVVQAVTLNGQRGNLTKLVLDPVVARANAARQEPGIAAHGHDSEAAEARGRDARQKKHNRRRRRAAEGKFTPLTNVTALCSTSVEDTHLLPADAPCPQRCPFSQTVEGVSCEKVCVAAHKCGDFHPVRFFANEITQQCEPPCGGTPDIYVAGCTHCVSPGVCKRCSDGLFGFVSLELSEDGRQCINVGRLWWYGFYTLCVVAALLVFFYLMEIRTRDVQNGDVLAAALKRREKARTELMPDSSLERNFFYANMHRPGGAPDWLGGRGVALYFNWLLFGILVSLLLGAGGFYAFEFSDLADQIRHPPACKFSAGSSKKAHYSSLVAMAKPQQHKEDFMDHVEKYTDEVADEVRKMFITVQAPPTRGIRQKYQQFHERMFYSSIAMYAAVSLLTLGFSALQLRYVSARFDRGPCVRKFAALVSGLPSELVDCRRLTEHIRTAFAREDLEELWHQHAFSKGTSSDGEDPAESTEAGEGVSLEDRFSVIGSSIAYDFFEHQDDINREVSSWVEDLEGWRHNDPATPEEATPTEARASLPHNRLSRGVQTETRGEILKALEPELLTAKEKARKRSRAPLFDRFLLGAMGLPEEWPLALRGSGKAFVVFNTQAARDAAVDLARTGRLAPLRSGERGNEVWHRLELESAPCEPVSINWEHFSSWKHFPQKIALGVFLMALTIFGWILLYLPYAAFYAELMVIPGLEPSVVQDIILGLLIAIGNAILSVVIDKVTAWAGFLYKEDRDVTVLTLAFLGTLLNTVFDLAMVAIVAQGVMLEDAFGGKATGYDTVVANELFKLIVPGYLVVPYFGSPVIEHIVPYWLAKVLIRTHARVKLRHASAALRCPDFDICWRYSDVLNNTTICVVLLFFTGSRGWKVMCWLFGFMVLIYLIDKYLLLHAATTTVYDTDRLSTVFVRWWCVPTALLAGVVSFWGYKARLLTSLPLCVALPFLHVVLFLAAALKVEQSSASELQGPLLYSEAARQLRSTSRPWDFFNTNPVFCLRTRCLGPEISGWAEVTALAKLGEPGRPPQDCTPFARGSVWLLTKRSPVDPAASAAAGK